MEVRDARLLRDFEKFSVVQLESLDYDPLYPVLKYLVKDLDLEQGIWYTTLYVAYYNLASSHRIFQVRPEVGPVGTPYDRYPTGTERRALRGGVVDRYLSELRSTLGYRGLYELYTKGFGSDPEVNWNTARRNVETVWGNGRWASYKTAEILQKVHEWEIWPTDIGNDGSTGPRKGLALLYGSVEGNGKSAIATLDKQASDLKRDMSDVGIQLDYGQLETMLCDFHSMCEGRYYPGSHDTDEMLGRLLKDGGGGLEAVWEAREKTLPHKYLGELGGWYGVDKELCWHYKKTGQMRTREGEVPNG